MIATTKKIAIFIPAYNHERKIATVLDRIPKDVLDIITDIIMIDDASKDATTKVALEYKRDRKMHKLTIQRNEKNQGYGGNQKLGYEYCIKKGYDIVVMLHGDGQYAPEVLPSLLQPLLDDSADMVFGSRMTGHPLKGGMPLYKFLGNKFLTFVENVGLGMHLSEFHSGYRLYSCHALKQIPFTLCSNNFHFDTEILIQFKKKGLRIVERPIPTYYGDEISYVNVIPYGINCVKAVMEYRLHQLGLRRSAKYDIQ
jgi:glycosyltransferase involved in cell wall biosynthesis